MIDRFEVLSSGATRPDAQRVIFCDGTDGKLFRYETDLELSHWRPNTTPTAYRAGTSTEICFRFLDNPSPGPWTVAVNNHVDVDGILAVYTLIHSSHAKTHRKTLIQAAEMGDFWGYGELAAQRVFQGITQLFSTGFDGKPVYEEAFRRIPGLVDGTDPQIGTIDESLAPLRRGIELVETGMIKRLPIGSHLVNYVIPREVAGVDDARASYVPAFNELISEKSILWPQVRAKWDAQRISLVSMERGSGWFHDLYFPGYHWADTEELWRVPGMNYSKGMNDYELDHPSLIAAFEKLQSHETGAGQWSLGGTRLEHGTNLQKKFPLVGRFSGDDGHSAVSNQSPEKVAAALEFKH